MEADHSRACARRLPLCFDGRGGGPYKARMILLAAVCSLALAQVDPSTYDCLRWRCIGPFRGGRTVGAAGIADQPDTFYIGVNNGGIWKTDDFGRTWKPLFDDQPTG